MENEDCGKCEMSYVNLNHKHSFDKPAYLDNSDDMQVLEDAQISDSVKINNAVLAPSVIIYQRHQKVLAFGKRYHVCVIYKDSDPTLRRVSDLVRELENFGFICYYKCRDFIPGQRYPKTIVQCFEQSMKLIIVLNK